MLTIYELKPRFQNLLRPLVVALAHRGVTANQITLLALFGSCAIGLLLVVTRDPRLFLLLPLWMFIRMALNAIDGMLAREFAQKSTFGGYLNELSDVISDTALIIPFALFPPFSWPMVGAVVVVSIVTEMAGVLGMALGGQRRYDGPMGKSDRAFVFGALGLWLGLAGALPLWARWIMLIVLLGLVISIINRIKNGIASVK